MLTDKLQEIEEYKSKIAALEKSVESERSSELRSLHTKMGFETRDELISALKGLEKGGKTVRKRRGKAKKAAAPVVKKKGRSKRARISPDVRKSIEDALKAGTKGTEVARKYGVSVPTIQNIKKALGLTRSR